MPLKIIHRDHIEIIGRGFVLLSNRPGPFLPRETYTGKIVEEIALLSKAHAIIEKELKGSDSLGTQDAESEFETALQRICADSNIKCVIVIDGKKEGGIQIRTIKADEDAKAIIELLRAGFAVDFSLPVRIESAGSDHNPSVPDSIQLVSLSLGLDEMGYRRETIITAIADTVGLVNSRLGHSESPSNSLD